MSERYHWAAERDGWPVLVAGRRYPAERGPSYKVVKVTERPDGGHRYVVRCGQTYFEQQDHVLLSLLRHPVETEPSRQLSLL